jgi:hypothetical protein
MDRKIGEGHADAMLRLGLKELRNLANPSRESVADQEIGLYGTATQGEIAEARGGPGTGPEQESMSLNDLRTYAKERAQAADRVMEQGKEQTREQGERDRGGPEM